MKAKLASLVAMMGITGAIAALSYLEGHAAMFGSFSGVVVALAALGIKELKQLEN